MAVLLVPGRHVGFTEEFVSLIGCISWNGIRSEFPEWTGDDNVDTVVFAVTSSNQSHSRYNPVPFAYRAIGVDRIIRGSLEGTVPDDTFIFGIPHYHKTDKFIHNVLTEIEIQSGGKVVCQPYNTLVLTGTQSIAQQYMDAGFQVLNPVEKLGYADPYDELSSVLMGNKDIGESVLSAETKDLFRCFPNIMDDARRLYTDPVLNAQGAITAGRDYNVYTRAMANESVLDLKYQDIKPYIREGLIVDEGCADGSLLTKISADFPDSDLIGVELAAELMARCQERQRAGQFGGSFVSFLQRNLMFPIFRPNSIDTTICNSTTHEIWSYGEKRKSLLAYLRNKYAQLKPSGRLLIRDVVGPKDVDRSVVLWAAGNDGEYWTPQYINEEPSRLRSTSTQSRLDYFMKTYRHLRGEAVMRKSGFYDITLKDAIEFMTKKDYVDNWHSEMQEEFAFWSIDDWKEALDEVGFINIQARTYQNPWIVANSWSRRHIVMFDSDLYKQIDYPDTNIVICAEK